MAPITIGEIESTRALGPIAPSSTLRPDSCPLPGRQSTRTIHKTAPKGAQPPNGNILTATCMT